MTVYASLSGCLSAVGVRRLRRLTRGLATEPERMVYAIVELEHTATRCCQRAIVVL
jgi:hypothetical protein